MDLKRFDDCLKHLGVREIARHMLLGMVKAAPEALQGSTAELPRKDLRALAGNNDELLDKAVDELFVTRRAPEHDADFSILRQFRYSVKEPQSSFEFDSRFLSFWKSLT